MGIRVKAICPGFYPDTLRQVGEIFEVQDESHLGRWMEKVDAHRVVEKAKKTSGKKFTPETFSELNSMLPPDADDLV